MRLLTIVRNRLRSLFRSPQADSELEAEFEDHLQRQIDYNIQAGMAPREARLAALQLMGPISFHQEQCRDWRGTAFVESCARDARYAVQMLRRTPLFSAAAILMLAVGIGANTAVFTFIENILLRPVPARDSQELAFLNWGGEPNLSYPNYLDLRDGNRVFSGLVAYRYVPVSMSVRAGENYREWGYEVSGNYFQTLGIQPLLGRFFGPAEDGQPGANPVVVISSRLWRRRFAAASDIVGRQVRINGYPFTVAGVAPPGFGGTELIVSADYWAPLSMVPRIEPGSDWLHSRSAQNLWTIGRLKTGVSRAHAEANLNQIAQELARSYPHVLDGKLRFRLSSPGLIGQALRGPITGFGVVLMGIGAIVLLLACINLAGMLSARAADRRREIGIRLALGASKGRLLRQLMTESLLLAAIGGFLGFGLAEAGCRLFSSWRLNIDLPIETTLQPNLLVLCFTAAAALATTVVFGLLPAIQAIRTDLIPAIKNSPGNRFRRWGVRDLLVTGQITLSVILVISSVLMVRSLQRALTVNLGFDPAHAISASFDLRLQGYDGRRSRSFDSALLAKAAALPGIQASGIISNFPLRIGEDSSAVSRADRPVPPPSERRQAIVYSISPGYLQAAGTKLLLGRDLDSRDSAGGPPVALVNRALADLLFPKEQPLGKHIRTSTSQDDPGLEIVGLVETGKYESLGEDPKPVIFLPIGQTGTAETTLVARTALPARQAVELLRTAILDLDPELTLYNVGELEDQLTLPLFPARAAAIVLGIFGFLAMVLAATGLFALMAYAVARRTREIGIRIALGARPAGVLSSLLRRTLMLCGTGVLLGALTTLAAGSLLSAVLYNISPRDPVTYVSAIVLVATVALLACWNPAARAIRIDPARTLRDD